MYFPKSLAIAETYAMPPDDPLLTLHLYCRTRFGKLHTTLFMEKFLTVLRQINWITVLLSIHLMQFDSFLERE